MSNQNNNRIFETQQTILAALFIVAALVGGCWLFSYHAYITLPPTETITVTLPPEMVASKTGLAKPAETIEIEQEKPWRVWASALFHPFGFMLLLLVIIAAGAFVYALALLGVRYEWE